MCFSATQAILAAKAGATFISPFVGRLDDIGENGMELIKKIISIKGVKVVKLVKYFVIHIVLQGNYKNIGNLYNVIL